MKRALAAAGLAALASCADSGGLHPQTLPTDAATLHSEHALAAVALTPAAWPKQDWWTRVGDPQLDALMVEALAGSPSLATADARSRAAIAQAQGINADRQPRLAGSAQYSGIRIPESVAPPPFGGTYQAIEALSLRLSWSPDLWGGQRASWEAAVDRARAAEVDAQAARIAVSMRVAEAYATLGYGFDERELAQTERERATKLLALTRQRVAAGIDSRLQLRQAESALPAVEQSVQAAQLRIDGARAALAALLGAGPDRGLGIERPKAVDPAAFALPSVLPAELLGRRADLVAARWRAQAAGRDIRVAQTRFYPNLNLSAAAGLASGGITNLFEAGSVYYQLSPAISLPIFDGGRLRANLAGSDAQYDLAVGDYNQKLVDALRDVATAITGLHSLADQAAQQRQAQTLARDAYDLALQRYRDGIGSYLEALTVQAALLRADAALAELHIRQLDASLQLIQALGGGWQGEDAALASAPPNNVQTESR